jgi:anti-sigma factor ChrR (cupin superfamily)
VPQFTPGPARELGLARRRAMTGTGTCEEIRLELGVYVLGAIGAADRSAVGAHLACCADCRDELAELAGLPGLLSRVTADDAGSLGLDRDEVCGSGHEQAADWGLRQLLGRAGAVAASERHKTAPCRTRRAIRGKQSGDSTR